MPVVGPTLGGYLTVQYNWRRWIFYINVPVGGHRPPRGHTSWSKTLITSGTSGPSCVGRPLNFDYIGLGLLILIMSSWEVMLSKGHEGDWYNDPYWRVQTLFSPLFVFIGLADL